VNSRNKRALYVLVPGAIILVWRVWAILSGGSPQRADAGSTAEAATVQEAYPPVTSPMSGRAAVGITAKDDPRLALQAQLEQGPWTRHPFRPAKPRVLEAPTQRPPAPPLERLPAPHWNMTGVMRTGGKYAAILNGQTVSVGDVVEGGFEVVNVTLDSVTVRHRGWTFRYLLGRPHAEAQIAREETPE